MHGAAKAYADALEPAFTTYQTAYAQAQDTYNNGIRDAYGKYLTDSARPGADLVALRHSYDVTEANLLHTYRQSYQSAINAWSQTSETELATYRKARVRADMTQGNALQLAGAEYDVAMTRASSTLGSGLRSAQRQYDKDLKKLADDIATESRNANRAWNKALVDAGLKLAQGSITDAANRQAAQATAMGTYLSAIQSAFSTAFGGAGTATGTGGDGATTGGTGTNGTGTNTSGTGGNPFTAMASLATASAGWMSTVLGLSVAKDQAIGDATEDRGVAKAKAEDGLIEEVVAGVQEWLNGTISARAAFRIASIGFNAAKGVAYRSAVAAYDIADINRQLEASEQSRAAGSARALSLAQDERDAVVNRPQSEWSSQAPSTPMIWYGMPITPEDQAASRAYQYRETMDHWGVTALRTWIAEVDASGVLDEEEAEQSPANPGPDSNNNPASPGNGPSSNPSNPNSNPQTGAGSGTGTSTGSGEEANAWDAWVAEANAALNPPSPDAASAPQSTAHTNGAGPAGGAPATGAPTTGTPPSPIQPSLLDYYRDLVRNTYSEAIARARSWRSTAQAMNSWVDGRPNAQPVPVPNENRIGQAVAQGRNAQRLVIREAFKAPGYALDAIANAVEVASTTAVNIADGNSQALREQSVALRTGAATVLAAPIAVGGDILIDAVNESSQAVNGQSLLNIDLMAPLNEAMAGANIIDKSATQGGQQGAMLLMLLASGKAASTSARPSTIVIVRFEDAADEYLKQRLATPSARAAKARLYRTSLPENGTSLAKIADVAPKIRLPTSPGGTGTAYNQAAGQGVYILRNPKTGRIEYVGRGDVHQRLRDHAMPGSGKEDLVGEILFDNNLPAAHAQSLENELMHMFGGPKSINPATSLRNKIQGIGEGNPHFIDLEFAADDDLVFEALRRMGELPR